MSYPTTGNLTPHFADLSSISADVRALKDRADVILKDIRPALIGQRVFRYGRHWQIVQIQVNSGGEVSCYGVTVSRKGKVGTRGFDLGLLEHCDFMSSANGGSNG